MLRMPRKGKKWAAGMWMRPSSSRGTERKGEAMSSWTRDDYRDGKLVNGYDYDRQCWVKDGTIQDCGHPETMRCGCFGRAYRGCPWDKATAHEA